MAYRNGGMPELEEGPFSSGGPSPRLRRGVVGRSGRWAKNLDGAL